MLLLSDSGLVKIDRPGGYGVTTGGVQLDYLDFFLEVSEA